MLPHAHRAPSADTATTWSHPTATATNATGRARPGTGEGQGDERCPPLHVTGSDAQAPAAAALRGRAGSPCAFTAEAAAATFAAQPASVPASSPQRAARTRRRQCLALASRQDTAGLSAAPASHSPPTSAVTTAISRPELAVLTAEESACGNDGAKARTFSSPLPRQPASPGLCAPTSQQLAALQSRTAQSRGGCAARPGGSPAAIAPTFAPSRARSARLPGAPETSCRPRAHCTHLRCPTRCKQSAASGSRTRALAAALPRVAPAERSLTSACPPLLTCAPSEPAGVRLHEGCSWVPTSAPTTSTTTAAAAWGSGYPMRATQGRPIFSRSAARSGLLRQSPALLSRARISPADASPAGPRKSDLLVNLGLRAAPRTAVPTGLRLSGPSTFRQLPATTAPQRQV